MKNKTEILKELGYAGVTGVQSSYLNLIAEEIVKKNQKRQSAKDTLKRIEELLNEAYERDLI